jgi:pimeloyl-ACP methyl ester carboxylesterase
MPRTSCGAPPACTKEHRTATLTTKEQQQIGRANASGLQPVVFVHGLWLLSGSWDNWRQLFEQQVHGSSD